MLTRGRLRTAFNSVRSSSSNTGALAVSKRNHLLLLALATFLLLFVSAAAAMGDAGADPGNGSQIDTAIPVPDSQAELESLAESDQWVDLAPVTDPSAAKELPHVALQRPQAEELFEAAFPSVLESTAQQFDDLEVEKFHSDYVAVVAPPEGSEEASPGLLSSTLPLRAENQAGEKELVDLDLESAEGRLQPENPLVSVEIPLELSQGIVLPETGITIAVAQGEKGRSASEPTQASAFYPNVRPDTDIAISPSPTGVETYTQLRSPNAPLKESFALTLPEGAHLKSTDSGGAEVLDEDGTALLSVHTPWAVDASGAPVPTSLQVSGDAITISVDPPADAAFPILLDPVFETYNFSSGSGPGMDDWQETANQGFFTYWGAFERTGMTVENYGGAQTSPGNQGSFTYHVPRFFYGAELPTSYIREMQLWGLTYGMPQEVGPANLRPAYPFMQLSLWDGGLQQVAAIGTRFGYEGQWTDPNYVFSLKNANENEGVKSGGFALATYDSVNPSFERFVNVKQAMVEVTDRDSPSFGLAGSVSGWVNSQPGATIPYRVSDSGLGIQKVRLVYPASTGGTGETVTNMKLWGGPQNCSGAASMPCPRTAETATQALAYPPALMAQGEDWVHLYGVDPVGHTSSANEGEVRIRVDHTAPGVVLSGTMTEQENIGTRRASYTLKATASDGNAEHPQSGVVNAEVKLDGKAVAMEGKQAEEWSPRCATQNCPLLAEWTLNTAGLSEGKHTIEVVVTDAVGLSATKTLTIETHPATAPTLTLSGSMTEQATLGTSRPRYTLKAKSSAMAAGFESATLGATPTYSSTIGSYGEANGQFLSTADVAVDGLGDVWVVDKSLGRVQEFNEKGEWMRSVGGAGYAQGRLSSPSAVDIDPSGNVWVADTANNRAVEYSATGVFLEMLGAEVDRTKVEAGGSESEKNLCTAASGDTCKAGTAGSLPGQLKAPAGIAAPPTGGIWVVDTGNNRLEKFKSTGVNTVVIANSGGEPGQLKEPSAIAFTPSGGFWVTDTGNNRIEEWNVAGTFERAIGKEGAGDGEFKAPVGIAVDASGGVWVGDRKNNRVEEFDEVGNYVAKFGSAGSGSGQFSMSERMGLATDPKGSIWVTDGGHFRVQHWIIPGFPVYSSSVGSSGSGNGQFMRLAGVASDSQGHVWALDQELGRVQEFNEKGEWLHSSVNTGNGKLNSPQGIAIDTADNVWVADTGNNRIVKFGLKGEFLLTFGTNVDKTKVEAGASEVERNVCTAFSGDVCQAATPGSSAGQLSAPKGITVAPNGKIWVADTGNSRLEKFTQTGGLILNLFGPGSEPGKLKEPSAITVSPDGSIWVADTGNNRIQAWSSTLTLIHTIGKEGSGGGEFRAPAAVAADSSGNIWVGDQKNNRVEEFGEGGRYRGQFGANGSGTFSFSAPMGLAVDNGGSIWVADPGHSKIQRWSQETPRSEITTTIWMDNVQKATLHGTCKTAGCTIEPSWTLESAALEAKSHVARVKTTDGLGRSTESTANVSITRDTTPPDLEVTGELFNAPEGWVQQETYGLNATATDAGFGITSIAFKIDGTQVASASQSCPEGGCKETLMKQISMTAYSGGSHMAEMIATDGAGHASVKKWAINVDPEGHISTVEAEATLEAIDGTSPVNTVGEAKSEAEYEGTAEGLTLEEVGGNYSAFGSATPTTVGANGAFTIEVAPPEAYVACKPDVKQSGSQTLSGSEEEELAAIPCEDQTPLGPPQNPVPVEITPVGTTDGPQELTNESSAVVEANAAPNVDVVTRPLFDGAMTFAAIRDSAGPESFTWEVEIEPDQELKLLDPQDAQVDYSDGIHHAVAITAAPAHDAIGTHVPTELSVVGRFLTLTVKHHAASYVYPIVAGAGWEGGFQTYKVEMPPPTEQAPVESGDAEEYSEVNADAGLFAEATYGPPEPDNSPLPQPWSHEDTSIPVRRRAYNFFQCTWKKEEGWEEAGGYPSGPHYSDEIKHGCHTGVIPGNTVNWAISNNGVYKYKPHHWSWAKKPNCLSWGPNGPAVIRRYSTPEEGYAEHVDAICDYRFASEKYLGPYWAAGDAACFRLDGPLPDYFLHTYPGEKVLENKYHMYVEGVLTNAGCTWANLGKIA